MSRQGEVVVIDCDGNTSVQLLALDEDTLRQLYRLTDSRTVDCVGLAPDLDMWLDDDGMVIGRPMNVVATLIAREHGMVHQPYVGTALFARSDDDGNTVGLTPQRVESLLADARRIVFS